MKFTFATVLLAATLGFGACGNAQNSTDSKAATSTQAQASYEDLDAAAFKVAIEKKDGTVLDVRTPAEVAEGVIPGAVHINIHDNDFAARAAKLDKTKPVYVYCKAGGRSARASKQLKDAGFATVYNLDSGITGWNRAGYETTSLK